VPRPHASSGFGHVRLSELERAAWRWGASTGIITLPRDGPAHSLSHFIAASSASRRPAAFIVTLRAMSHLGKTAGDVQLSALAANVEEANTVAVYEKFGTQHDEIDMDRMGKLQQLRVSGSLLLECVSSLLANQNLSETSSSSRLWDFLLSWVVRGSIRLCASNIILKFEALCAYRNNSQDHRYRVS
jgi:hypothetical protein